MKGKIIKSRLLAGAAAASLCIGGLPGACVRAEEQDDVAMGRYLESEVTLPEGINVRDVKGLSDGTLRIIGNQAGEIGIWDSSDGGESWEQAAILPEEYFEYYFAELVLAPDGGGAGIYMKALSEASEEEEGGTEAAVAGSLSDFEFYYLSFDDEGNAQSTALSESYPFNMQFSADGNVLGDAGGEITVRSRETGEVIHTIACPNVRIIGSFGTEVFGITDFELQRYDIETGEPIARDEALEEALFVDGGDYSISSDSSYPIAFAEDGERLYYLTDKGIFAHVMGGSVVEQIVDGSLNSLSDPGIGRGKMAVLDQVFYVTYVTSQGGSGMKKYAYSEDVSSVPQKELTIYSLKEDDVIKQMAVLFQKEYPDTYVNYTYGTTGEDGVTASDALRTLNTDILAGNGPDILVMDDLSVQTYAEKGVLADLGGILQEIDENDGVFENIAYTYREGDTVPAVPALFCIPVVAGKAEYVEKSSDLAAFGELASMQGVLSARDVSMLPELLYPVCAGGWKNEDNTIDQEKLAQYVEGVKRIYDNYAANASPEDAELLEIWGDGLPVSGLAGYFEGDILYSTLDLLMGKNGIALGTLTSMDGYANITSANLVNGDCVISPLNGLQSDVFRPYCVLGILNTAKDAKLSGEFVKFVLGEKGQTQQYANGFPVNEKAFDKLLTSYEYGEDTNMGYSTATEDESEIINVYIYWPTEEEAARLKDLIGQLAVCADEESIQKDVILEQTKSCIQGEVSVEEAVNAVMQKINIYLAE